MAIVVSVFTVRLYVMQISTHDIGKAFLSVRPSVCPSNTWIVTKRKKVIPTFLYHMKYHSS